MLQSYLPILLLLGVAIVVPLGFLFASRVFGPTVRVEVKAAAYECGVPAVGESGTRHPVKFYRTAILFLIFDVEAALLFPWAVIYRSKLPQWGVAFLVGELLVFLLILLAGYAYAWRKGALEWD